MEEGPRSLAILTAVWISGEVGGGYGYGRPGQECIQFDRRCRSGELLLKELAAGDAGESEEAGCGKDESGRLGRNGRPILADCVRGEGSLIQFACVRGNDRSIEVNRVGAEPIGLGVPRVGYTARLFGGIAGKLRAEGSVGGEQRLGVIDRGIGAGEIKIIRAGPQ